MNEIIDNKIKEKQLVKNSNISGFKDNINLEKIIATLATKTELKTEQDKITKLQTFDSTYFGGKNHFEDNDTKNCLLLPPVSRYFKTVANTSKVTA